VRYQNGTLPTDYAFTHQRSDATSGLDFYGARFYDPVAGQFTSADTTLAGGLNRYAAGMAYQRRRT
jgi:RHS repeat-associated protein